VLISSRKLSLKDKFTIVYHSLFSFPLRSSELERWKPGEAIKFDFRKVPLIFSSNEFYFIKEEKKQVKERLRKEKFSKNKIKIAKEYSEVLKFLPFIKFIGITGSLAMGNADFYSDIDLLIITKRNTLWTTRLLVLLFLKFKKISVRRSFDKEVKDKLCLNMWLDEEDLEWHDRNLFSAHEIAQIVPIFNREKTYERFIFLNSWIFDFWPNAIPNKERFFKDSEPKKEERFLNKLFYFCICNFVEPLSYFLERLYMRGKITREIVSRKRAIFHPVDWSKKVIRELKRSGAVVL
jgi:predicted nucleotidyltransferase